MELKEVTKPEEIMDIISLVLHQQAVRWGQEDTHKQFFIFKACFKNPRKGCVFVVGVLPCKNNIKHVSWFLC